MSQLATVRSLMTCLVAGSQYLLHPQKLASIQETINPDALIPVTLLDKREIYGDVEETLRKFALRDDVYHPAFAFVLVEKPGPNGSGSLSSASSRHDDAPPPGRSLYRLRDDGRGDGDVSLMAGPMAKLPSGPYFLHGPNLYEAWKLYEDHSDAFAFGVIPENVTAQTTSFRTMSSLAESGSHKSVAVPSRLYHRKPTPERPLSGVRVALPDAASLPGVPTTLSSRSWQSVHGDEPDSAIADLARRLLDLGAVVVGKTRSSQLAAGREWVDEQQPWNPRGDGYRRAPAGAAGAASAVATYEWLSAAFGLDGIGGVREPAAAHGLFSLRTTPGLVPLAGLQISSPSFDSVGLVSRDLAELSAIASAVLNQTRPDASAPAPKRLVYLTDMAGAGASEEQQRLAARFLGVLERSAGLVADKVNVSATWEKSPPPEAKGQPLEAYIKDSAFRAFCYDFYHEYDAFRKEYQDRFNMPPYTEASTKFRWETGANVSKQEYDEHRGRIGVFRRWFGDNIAPVNNSGDAWTAVVTPFQGEAPRYRDEFPSAPATPVSLTAELLPSMLEAPQVLVPFAHVAHESRISARKEYEAVYGVVMGPKGGDLAAVQAVQKALEKAQWRTKVDAGRLAFPETYVPPEAQASAQAKAGGDL